MGDLVGDIAAHRRKPEQPQHRQEDCERQQGRCKAAVPWAISQPEMQPDASMHPDHDQCDRLSHANVGRVDPERPYGRVVCVGKAVEAVDDPRGDDVVDQQQRHQQPGDNLEGLADRHPKRPAKIQRPEHQKDMDDDRTVEKAGADGIAPYQQEDKATFFRCMNGDQPERMVADMHQHEQEHDQTRAQSGSPDGSVGKQGMSRRYGFNPPLDGCSQMRSDRLTKTGHEYRHATFVYGLSSE